MKEMKGLKISKAAAALN